MLKKKVQTTEFYKRKTILIKAYKNQQKGTKK